MFGKCYSVFSKHEAANFSAAGNIANSNKLFPICGDIIYLVLALLMTMQVSSQYIYTEEPPCYSLAARSDRLDCFEKFGCWIRVFIIGLQSYNARNQQGPGRSNRHLISDLIWLFFEYYSCMGSFKCAVIISYQGFAIRLVVVSFLSM
jgi:hypothetical protein